MGWEFHFRNFSPRAQDFGVYHASCLGAPWHTGRARCWEATVGHNPKGGGNSVYAPNRLVVDIAGWLTEVMDIGKVLMNLGIFVGGEFQNESALFSAIQDATNIPVDTEKALKGSQATPEQLLKDAQQGFADACQRIGQTQEQVIQYAEQMGLGPSNWGLISGQSYQDYIFKDNSINNNQGWTVLRCDEAAGSWASIANAAFLQNGHLYYLLDPSNVEGWWNDFN